MAAVKWDLAVVVVVVGETMGTTPTTGWSRTLTGQSWMVMEEEEEEEDTNHHKVETVGSREAVSEPVITTEKTIYKLNRY